MKKLVATLILIGLLLVYPLVATEETSVEGLGYLSVGVAQASPDEVTYYFDAYDTGVEEWTTTPQYAVDNITTNYASTTTDNQVERLTGNTCPGDDLGTITKVEIRAYAYGDGNDELYIRPEFVGETGANYITVPTTEGSWGDYRNITNDANAPSPWTWTDVQSLECDIELNDVAAGKVMYVSKVEIRVTYGGAAPKGGSVAFVRATEGAIDDTVLTLNIEVSAGTDRVLVVGLAYRDASVLVPTSILFNTDEAFSLEKTAADGGDAQCFFYYLAAPTETTADVVITMPDSVRMVGYVAYFTGVDQNNPFSINTAEAQGTNDAPTVDVSSTADEIVIDILAQVSAGPDTATATHTEICNGAATGGGSDTRGAGQYVVGQATRTMNYSMSDADNWNIIAGGLQEPGAGPDIDIGAGAIDRVSTIASLTTCVDKNNPANASGILHTVKVYAYANIEGLRVGTFYTTNGNTLKCRDSEIPGDGTVEAGAERTFTELSITVVEGDYIGCYFTSGNIERDIIGYAGVWSVSGEYIDPDDETEYSFLDGDAISLYGYGDTDGVCTPDISNLPISKDFLVVAASTDYWSSGTAPEWPLDDGECFFTVTNNSGGTIDIVVKGTNFTGGNGWTLTSGVPGEDTVRLRVGKSGDTIEGDMVILTTGDQSLITGLVDSATKKWELKLETGTYTDGDEKTGTVTLTASCQ